MALSFPLSVAEVQGTIPIQSASIRPMSRTEGSETAAGEYLKRRLGPDLWAGQVQVHPVNHARARGVLALVAALEAPGASFLLRDPAYFGPADDLGGTILGAAVPKITAVAGSGDVTLGDMPALYWLRRGDYLSFTYGSGPVRYALHMVAQDRRSGGTGNTTLLPLVPPVRPGWVAGTPVELVRPVCKAQIVPGSVSDPTMQGLRTSGISFRWQQVLR